MNTTMDKTELEKFREKFTRNKQIDSLLFHWHVNLHRATGIELPYNVDNQYVSLNMGEWKYVSRPTPEDAENQEYEYELDVEASVAQLAKVVKYATDSTMVTGIKKNYSDNSFSLEITLSHSEDGPTVTLYYSVKREAVCTKKVVGTEWVEPVAGYSREIVEWDCGEPVSLLALANKE